MLKHCLGKPFETTTKEHCLDRPANSHNYDVKGNVHVSQLVQRIYIPISVLMKGILYTDFWRGGNAF